MTVGQFFSSNNQLIVIDCGLFPTELQIQHAEPDSDVATKIAPLATIIMHKFNVVALLH